MIAFIFKLTMINYDDGLWEISGIKMLTICCSRMPDPVKASDIRIRYSGVITFWSDNQWCKSSKISLEPVPVLELLFKFRRFQFQFRNRFFNFGSSSSGSGTCITGDNSLFSTHRQKFFAFIEARIVFKIFEGHKPDLFFGTAEKFFGMAK